MLRNEIDKNASLLEFKEYDDATAVIKPEDHDYLNVVISGNVFLIAEESLYKKVMSEIKIAKK